MNGVSITSKGKAIVEEWIAESKRLGRELTVAEQNAIAKKHGVDFGKEKGDATSG